MDEIIALGRVSRHDERYTELTMPSTRATGHSGIVVGARSCYPANIAAACYEANVALHERPQPVKVEDDVQREKRRRSNRLSAQRWRMRKRSKFSELQDQIRLLQKDQEELELENSKLKDELKLEMDLAKEEAAQKSSQLMACPPENPRQQAYYQNASLGHHHEWLEKSPPRFPHGHPLASSRFPHGQPMPSPSPFPEGASMFAYKTGSNIGQVNRFMPISGASHPMLTQQVHIARSDTFGFPQGSGVSHAELRNMIRTANAPCMS